MKGSPPYVSIVSTGGHEEKIYVEYGDYDEEGKLIQGSDGEPGRRLLAEIEGKLKGE